MTKAKIRKPKTLAERVRARRSELGRTQLEVAEAAGMIRESYARIEGGGRIHVQVDTLRRLAAALEVTVGELVPDYPGLRPI